MGPESATMSMREWVEWYTQRHRERNPGKGSAVLQDVWASMTPDDWVAERVAHEEFPRLGIDDQEAARRNSLVGAVLARLPKRFESRQIYSHPFSTMVYVETLRVDRERHPEHYDGPTYLELRSAPWRQARLSEGYTERERSTFALEVRAAYDQREREREAAVEKYGNRSWSSFQVGV